MRRLWETTARVTSHKAFWAMVSVGVLGIALIFVMRPILALASSRLSMLSDGSQRELTDPKVEKAGNFFCYVEVLTADRPSAYGYIAPRGCIPSGEFKRGERIVWRFEILDTSTGGKVTDKEAASVRLRLPHGEEVEADFKQRGEGRVPDAPWTWDVCWDTPLDYPLGTLDYSIMITTKDGRTGNWKPPALIDLARGIDSRIRILE